MNKPFLFLLRSCPHGGIHVQEMLDMILTSAAMDQTVSLLFLDDGVFQLIENQRPEVLGLKHIAPIFQSLPIYDVGSFWVERESLCERGIGEDVFILPAKTLPRRDVPNLLASHGVVVSV